MSAAAASAPPPASRLPGAHGGAPAPVPQGAQEACPLCGSPLHPEQEWCLRCGAAARTRLAATPNWRTPIAAIVAVVALSLGVLTAALVDLAGSSNAIKTQVTRTLTTAPAATAPAATAPVAPLPGTTPGAAPGATTPGASPTAPSTATTPRAGTGAGTAKTRVTPVPGAGATGTGSIIPGVTIPSRTSPARK